MTAPLAGLIDTNVFSEMMRPQPEPQVVAYLNSITDDGLGLADRFHDLLDELFENRIVDWTLADACACARIMEDRRRCGAALDDHVQDAFFAAATAARGLSVVNRNIGDFHNTGVEPVGPWTAAIR